MKTHWKLFVYLTSEHDMNSLCNPHHLKNHYLFCFSSLPAGVDVLLCLIMLLSQMCVGRSARWNCMEQTKMSSVSFYFRITREKEWSSCFVQRHSKNSRLPSVYPITIARHLLDTLWLSFSYPNTEISNAAAEQRTWKTSSCHNKPLMNHLAPLSS